ncbi:MAG: DNA recombination protein RmuC, partial [Duodenibacillus sp.]|nr:DNA recombination protein RmuC [Duodenibacillus sp.]
GRALERIRGAVEEKLGEALERNVAASFETVRRQLQEVDAGLGEMRRMAAGVDGLRRVIAGVKTRGNFGEMQLGALMADMLAPGQYALNVATRPGSREKVEFAIRLPGGGEGEVWLPVDAKFPLEDYERLLDAQERADHPAAEAAGKALEARIRAEARKIRTKYVEPPYTTEFAVMFLPSEGLWAEVLRRPGLMEAVQRDEHVTVTGPAVFAGLLNSLQMGFRTLAIEKKSAEVWRLLSEVRGEFGKFGEALDKLEKNADTLRSAISQVRTRSAVMNRKLEGVQSPPLAPPEEALPPAGGPPL